jgi:hypothetical protein
MKRGIVLLICGVTLIGLISMNAEAPDEYVACDVIGQGKQGLVYSVMRNSLPRRLLGRS